MIDFEMCDFELQVLRVMNGEDVPGMVPGAAMWTAAAWLKRKGYAQGHYEITQKGRDYLAGIDAAAPDDAPDDPPTEA